MYLDFKVDIPVVKGKITYREKAGTEYVYYEYNRIYDCELPQFLTLIRLHESKMAA